MVALFYGHLAFCVQCFHIYEEGGVKDARFVGKELYVFFKYIIKFSLCVFQKKNNNKINTLQKNSVVKSYFRSS